MIAEYVPGELPFQILRSNAGEREDITLNTPPEASLTITRLRSIAVSALCRTTAEADGLGQSTTYAYDSLGHRALVLDAEGHVTTTLYDALGRPRRRCSW